jgi:hypothetical protein
MSFLDAACFAEIQPEEMLLSNWTKPNKEEVAPTLTSLARQFNMWSGMVATDIILANSLMVRATGRLSAQRAVSDMSSSSSSINRIKSLW